MLKCRSCRVEHIPIASTIYRLFDNMLGLYLASVAYVKAEMKNLGPDNPLIAKSRESRVQHFLDSIVSMNRDIVDSANALEEIANETPAFSKEQRDTMASAVSTHMHGNDVASVGSGAKMQSHPNLAGYLTESLWNMLFDMSVSWDTKSEKFVTHCIEKIGLRNPKDETVKDLLGIMEICSKKELTPDDCLSEIRKIREKFVGQRSLLPGKQTMLQFPSDVNEFLRRFTYGKSFLQCDPPVQSRINATELRQHTRKDKMPTRGTNKSLSTFDTARNRNSQALASSSMANSQLDPTQQLANFALQFVLGSKSRDELRDYRNFGDSGGNGRSDNSQQLAIEDDPRNSPRQNVPRGHDASTDSSGQIVPRGHASTQNDDIDSITEMAKQTLYNKQQRTKKSNSKKSNSKKKQKVDEEAYGEDEDDNEEDGEDDEDDQEEEEEEEEVMKRPSSKRPSAAVQKKPAAAVDPAGKPLVNLDSPTHYGGGRIYWSEAKFAFRVYRRRGDKVESQIRLKSKKPKDQQTAWNACLKAIDDDPRPRDS